MSATTNLAAAELPVWGAILVAVFLVLGCGLTLLGTIGLARLDSFYRRIHAPTLGTTWGAGGVLIASMLFFSLSRGTLVASELLITVFVTVTTPVTLLLLGRAAVHRDRAEGSEEVPGARSKTPSE